MLRHDMMLNGRDVVVGQSIVVIEIRRQHVIGLTFEVRAQPVEAIQLVAGTETMQNRVATAFQQGLQARPVLRRQVLVDDDDPAE